MIHQEETNLGYKNQIFHLMDLVSCTFTIICDGGVG